MQWRRFLTVLPTLLAACFVALEKCLRLPKPSRLVDLDYIAHRLIMHWIDHLLLIIEFFLQPYCVFPQPSLSTITHYLQLPLHTTCNPHYTLPATPITHYLQPPLHTTCNPHYTLLEAPMTLCNQILEKCRCNGVLLARSHFPYETACQAIITIVSIEMAVWYRADDCYVRRASHVADPPQPPCRSALPQELKTLGWFLALVSYV